MKAYTANDLTRAIVAVGLSRGDTVYLHSRLFSLGMLEGSQTKEQLCAATYRAFREVIGEEGTLVVPTFTTDLGRNGGTFVLEASPCDTGILAEFVRTLPRSVRSLHPINSVCAIGPKAEAICLDVSSTNYGLDTPYDRMLRFGAKAVNLGFSDRFSNSWHHHVEAALGLPYLYNKLLDIDVEANGRKVPTPFFATLRYLDYGIENNLQPFDRLLADGGHLAIQPVGGSVVTCIAAERYTALGLAELKKNPYYFLRKPPDFRRGEIPWDGVPGARKAAAAGRAT
jgi:aminoglycoside N3'-acetyltransferase